MLQRLILLALLLPIVTAVQITDVTAENVQEGAILNVSFSTNVPATYSIFKDNILVSNSSTYAETTTYDDSGTYVFMFQASNNTTVTENRTVTVVDVPLEMTVHEPAKQDHKSQTVAFDIETNIPADACYTTIKGLSNTLPSNGTSHTGSRTFDEGLHTFSITCTRGGESANRTMTIKVDSMAPTVTVSPSGTVTSQPVILKATTNEVASCRYAETIKSFDEMEPFPTKESLTQSASLNLAEATHQYYVQCMDVFGNTGTAVPTTFTVQQAPSATVVVDGDNPHKTGTYEVEVQTSEPLQQVPTLKLRYQGEGAKTLALKQENPTTFTGIIVVAEDEGEKVGTFEFSGKDLDGLTGNTISSGELFVVDTIAPSKVEVLSVRNESTRINLSWYHPTAQHFNIYRSPTLGVTYTDLLASVSDSEYLDYDITDAITYYYRVAALDEAGNVGPLSAEVYGSAAAAAHEAERLDERLDPKLQVGLDDALKTVTVWLLDAEQTYSALQQEDESNKNYVIRTLGLLQEAQTAISTLKDVEKNLEELRSRNLEKEEFDSRISALLTRAENARKIANSIKIGEGSQYTEQPTEEEIEQTLQQVGKIGSKISVVLVEVQTLEASITMLNGEQEHVTIVEKNVRANEPIDAMILQQVPKQVSWLTATPQVAGGVARFSMEATNELRYSYTLPSLDATIQPSVGIPRSNEVNSVTGAVTNSPLEGRHILIGVGVLLIGVLAYYYVKLPEGGTPQTVQTITAPLEKPENTRTVLITREQEPITSLLMKGNSLIDDNRYLDALYFYKKAVESFNKETFSKNVLGAVQEELQLLYHKLQLFNATQQAHDAAYAEDHETLDKLLAEMRQHASAIGDIDTSQVIHAKSDYKYLRTALLHLQMERHYADDSRE